MTVFPATCRPLTVIALLAAGACVGCSQATAPPAKPAAAHDHDDDGDQDHHHDHDEQPTTLAEGLRKLPGLARSVKDHLAADDRDEADEAVHALGHLLESLQGRLGTSGLTADAKAAATKALDELFECFDKVDAAFHQEPGQGKPPAEVHAAVAERIERAIESLSRACSAAATDAEDEAATIIRESEPGRGREEK